MTTRKKIELAKANGIDVEYKEYPRTSIYITKVNNMFFAADNNGRTDAKKYLTRLLLQRHIIEVDDQYNSFISQVTNEAND